ncbi:hypothetical protein INS49_014812 [Diaporthe citri]|uniref:uncharacterized protein n=1 Tax=Diaporthe citri TaxID=83186 RepID=UPI001C7E97EE|nr:uncharacterized protein INS49_014812 [Diaporthe citri]KAG6356937.1 hypothetical protein INS49_014812 [Diaporthe citri]
MTLSPWTNADIQPTSNGFVEGLLDANWTPSNLSPYEIKDTGTRLDFVITETVYGYSFHDVTIVMAFVVLFMNLESALRHLRDSPIPEDQDLPVWVDAICINQEDLKGRNEQVRIMRDVYRKANLVISYLGDGDVNTDWALEKFRRDDFWLDLQRAADLGSSSDHRVEVIRASVIMARDLAERVYWSRVWIIQEIMLATQDPVLVCGSQTLVWSEHIFYADSIYQWAKTNVTTREHMDAYANFYVFTHPHLSFLPKQGKPAQTGATEEYWSRTRKLIKENGHAPLSYLFYSRFLEKEASCKSDYVYGLHGLLPQGKRDMIEIDDSRPPTKVFHAPIGPDAPASPVGAERSGTLLLGLHCPIVRLAPNILSFSDATLMPRVFHNAADKPAFYGSLMFGKTAAILQSLPHQDHHAKKRLVAPCEQDLKNQRLFFDGLSRNDLKAEVIIFTAASIDGVAAFISAFFDNLLTNPEVYARIVDEIQAADRACRLSQGVVMYEETTRLPFFMACIKETLRRDSPAQTILPRLVHVPPGTLMGASPYIVHRDEAVFGAEPEKWRPERWIQEESGMGPREHQEYVKGMERYGLWWGYGARECAGKYHAQMEMQKLCVELLRRFDIRIPTTGRRLSQAKWAVAMFWNQQLIFRARQASVS